MNLYILPIQQHKRINALNYLFRKLKIVNFMFILRNSLIKGSYAGILLAPGIKVWRVTKGKEKRHHRKTVILRKEVFGVGIGVFSLLLLILG